MRNDFRSARQKADDIYYLFMNRYGLIVPTSEEEHHNITFSEDVASNMLLTENSLRQILSGQLASARSWTFELKFPVAMRSIGWPADAFLKFLQPYHPRQLVTKTDDQERTVLHWAAKHFGYWACAYTSRDMCPDDTITKGYAVLMKRLVLMGADVHAVNSQHETPLMTALHQFMTSRWWPSCALAVKRWGEILVDAGLNLSDYIRVENPLLRSLASKRRLWNGETYYTLHSDETQLLILEGSILAVEMRFCRPVVIWEHRTPPGAWHIDSRLPTKSLSAPSWNDDNALFWYEVQKVKIYSKSYLIQATSEADTPFYSATDLEANWRSLFSGTQDDHGSVANTVLQDRSRNEANVPALRNRASSVPPEQTHKVYDRLPTIWTSGVEVRLDHQHWISIVYRCPVDPKRSWRPGTLTVDGFWTEENPRFLKHFDSRSPVERLMAEDDWEVQLLREHSDVDAVKRFGNRFCRELRDVIEEELATTRSIMELA
jgi:hypothetical protein